MGSKRLKVKEPVNSSPGVNRRKAMGEHYTPPELARFLADRLVRQTPYLSDAPLRVLDPACGYGVLLQALLSSLQEIGIARCEVFGVDANTDALIAAQCRLGCFKQTCSHLIRGDFLDLLADHSCQRSLWEPGERTSGLDRPFDIIIANPPYVRTQILGAERAQRLASRFNLSGRVDLYHAFIVAATEILRPGGVIGIITSNRFLTTLGGSIIRSYLARQYEIEEVIDLGDTKLFEAAVLPAIFIGRRRGGNSPHSNQQPSRFIKVYSQANTAEDESTELSSSASIFDILSRGQPGCYRVNEGVFKLTRGDLVIDQDPAQVWTLTTVQESEWLQRVRAASGGLFGDIAIVRVGIKTTADDVFIRSDWDTLPFNIQPEPELLRPLLRHEDACRWAPPGGSTSSRPYSLPP